MGVRSDKHTTYYNLSSVCQKEKKNGMVWGDCISNYTEGITFIAAPADFPTQTVPWTAARGSTLSRLVSYDHSTCVVVPITSTPHKNAHHVLLLNQNELLITFLRMFRGEFNKDPPHDSNFILCCWSFCPFLFLYAP
jgi:hypothetical protein